MKKKLLPVLILIAFMFINATAQNRINKYGCSNGCIKPVSQKLQSSFYPNALSGYYFEGFETAFPPMGWQIVDVLDTVNTWTPSTLADYPDAFEGAQSAYCRYAYPIGPGEDWFIAPKFTVLSGDSLTFQFKWESIGWQYDSTLILISITDSALSSFTNLVDSYVDTSSVQILNVAPWYSKSYSLNAYAGQEIYVAFVNKNTNGDGIFIDNVEMGTRPAVEAGVISISVDDFISNLNYVPKATVKNYGGVTQTFNVTMNITGGYTDTQPITLSPQASAVVSFATWNPTPGSYTLSVQTFLAGDANPANDTLSKSTQALAPFVNYGWSVHNPLPTPVIGAAALSVVTNTNSRIFSLGGLATGNFIGDGYEYDLSFNTWSSTPVMPSACGYAAQAHANNKLYVIGGAAFANGDPTDETKIYEPTMGNWSIGAPVPVATANMAFGTYKDSLVYLIGGNIGSVTATNLVQIYNTYTDTWTSGTPKPGTAYYAIRGGIIGNKIVVTGGFNATLVQATGDTYVGEIDTLNPTQITWTQVANHPAGLISRPGPGVSIDKNSSLVVFSGGTNTTTTADFTDRTFAYDVNSNSWKIGPNKPTGMNLFYMTSVVENDSLYLAALGGNLGNVADSDVNEWLNLGYFQVPTGVKENNLLTHFSLYPNPANEKINLQLNLKAASSASIIITDVLGHAVAQMENVKLNAARDAISIPIKNLANGMYYVTLYADENSVTKKFIKN